jgi:hypothetical protein
MQEEAVKPTQTALPREDLRLQEAHLRLPYKASHPPQLHLPPQILAFREEPPLYLLQHRVAQVVKEDPPSQDNLLLQPLFQTRLLE